MQDSQSGGFLDRVDLRNGCGVRVDGVGDGGGSILGGSILGGGGSGGIAGVRVSWFVGYVFGVLMSTVFLGVTVRVLGGSVAQVGCGIVTCVSVGGGGAMSTISSWIVLLEGGSYTGTYFLRNFRFLGERRPDPSILTRY